MKNIVAIWNSLVKKLEEKNVELQKHNDPKFKNRTPGIGEMVFNLSPITQLKEGHHKYYYGGSSIYYQYSLQIGSATKVDIKTIRQIFEELKGFLSEQENCKFNFNENNLSLSSEDQTISVNIDFEGTAYNSISLRYS
jgi:hypothetical protein